MNFLTNVTVSTIWSSTDGAIDSTGNGGSTVGNTGDGSTTKGGMNATASTGLDMSGYDGVCFIATVNNSSYAVLKAGFSTVSSTVAASAWTDFGTAYKQATFGSTVQGTIILDLYRPTQRYVSATSQVASSSGGTRSIVAIQYNADKLPKGAASTAYLVFGVNTVVGTTA